MDRVAGHYGGALSDLMAEVLVARYPQLSGRKVQSADLKQHGFDDDLEAPDPVDYW